MAATLDVRGLSVELSTRTGWVRPVNDVTFSLAQGETLGIVGESGSGKTMLGLALMGLEPPGARRSVARKSRHGRRQSCYEPHCRRAPGNAWAARARNRHGVSRPDDGAESGCAWERRWRRPSACTNRGSARTKSSAAVPEPEIRARQYPHQLSGGLRQRVLIAMALAEGPGVLIADETTTALDVTVQKQILELLAQLRRDLRLSLLFITHDLGVVARIADRVLVMYAGRIVEEGPAGEVIGKPRHPYTQGLLRAAPRLRREKLMPIPGAVPSLDALPPGCAFGPRCAQHIAECDAAVPMLRDAAQDHRARCILAS